jgi:hypothetical protein
MRFSTIGLLVTFGIGLLWPPHVATAQQPVKIPRKPRHDLRYPSVHFSRPYPVRSNSNSTKCCAEKNLRARRRRV